MNCVATVIGLGISKDVLTISNAARRLVSSAAISPLYKSSTGERSSLCPPTLNSVTSVAHFSFGR